MVRPLYFCLNGASAAPQSYSPPPEPTGQTDDIRVILVDDHPAIRTGLTSNVNGREGMKVVGTCATAGEALPLIEQRSPEVVVVEISLDGIDGLTLTRRLRSRVPTTRILVFSMYDESVYAEWAIRAGASGYLMKTQPTDEVVEAIREIDEGHVYLSPEIRSHILAKVIRQEDDQVESALEALTLREVTVFQMLGDGNSMAQIADHLNLSRKTVEEYRRRAKEKLGCETVDDLLQFAALWTSDRAGEGSSLFGGG